MFELISNDLNYSKFKFKTEALKYELHTLSYVCGPRPPPHTCTCAMHSCMQERYFLWCAHFLTTESKYLSPCNLKRCTIQLFGGDSGLQSEDKKVYISIVLGGRGATIRRRKGIHFNFFRWSLQFRDGMV
jgi:hypothetical protein